MASERLSVSWDNFHSNMSSGMNSLLENEDFVDVTLAVEGHYLKAHKMVLSVCSPYFRDLFKSSPCKHPIVFMKDVSYTVMSDLLHFMYQGEVQVNEENFDTFIKVAESLKIRGLTHDSANQGSVERKTPLKLVQEATVGSEEIKPPDMAPSSEEIFSFKTEPFYQEESATMMDDMSVDEFGDDPLEETNEFMEYGMEEVGTSTPQEGSGDFGDSTSSLSIPEKSREQYEQAFHRFELWCGVNDVKNYNETTLLAYFKEKSACCKSSSLWTTWSMLCNMLLIKKNVDIRKYRNLLAFMRRRPPIMSRTDQVMFKTKDVEVFLKTADDESYLMMKVAIIVGVAGACRRGEMINLLFTNVRDEGHCIRFKMGVREFVVTAGNIEGINLLEIIRKYMRLRPVSTFHQRFFLSYKEGKCTKQHVGINSLGAIPRHVAQFLGLKNPGLYTGHCFRRTPPGLRECMSWEGSV